MSPRRRSPRLHFEQDDRPPEPAQPRIDPLRFEVAIAAQAKPYVVDLTGLPDTPLVRQLGRGLLARFGRGNGARSQSTAEKYAFVLRAFIRWNHAPPPPAEDPGKTRSPVRELRHLPAAAIDAYEDALFSRIPESAHDQMKALTTLVRTAIEELTAPASPDGNAVEGFDPRSIVRKDLLERVRYSSVRPRPPARPLDGYSPHVTKQLRAGCRELMRATVQRITVEGPAMLRKGADPRDSRFGGWDRRENVLWEIDRVGYVTQPQLRAAGSELAKGGGIHQLHALLYPTVRDLYPLYVLLCLGAYLPPESAAALTVDDLTVRPGEGGGTLAYHKNRARRDEDQTRTVRTQGTHSPGNIFNIVRRLTQNARRHHPCRELWLAYAGTGPGGRFGNWDFSTKPLRQWFCAAIELTDDDGSPMRTIDLRRLRKSGKKQRYIELGGDVADFADDHTRQVAFTHYANIPALRSLHEATAARGITKALASAMRPTVLTPSDEEACRADPDGGTRALGVAKEQLLPLLNGELDVWLAACRDITDSPFAPRGTLCPATAWGCLNCRNAVITRRKLPNLLAFLNFLREQRSVLDEDAWCAVHGASYVRVTEYLAHFPEHMLVEARAIAEATECLPFLGIELQNLGGAT